MAKYKPGAARHNRHARVRAKVRGIESRPRLSVFRSLNHIYAQIIDDDRGHTLVSASTVLSEIKSEANGKNKSTHSGLVGSLVAKRALEKGIKQVVFDRGGYKYHGRVKSLAEAARKGGLKF
ncbi:MAG TPA: 50S ribosomal protein L18 [Dehalococcoidia bacterium]|nr:50S ribosomal protein L18 [Dehalococcoidia bacterium]